jgi:hypothetical protein
VEVEGSEKIISKCFGTFGTGGTEGRLPLLPGLVPEFV